VELYAFFYLLAYAFLRTAVRRVEGVVTAERASSCADFSVSVRAAEACVNAYLLYATAEDTGEICVVTVETSFHFCLFAKIIKWQKAKD
jgi:hypothetical protein